MTQADSSARPWREVVAVLVPLGLVLAAQLPAPSFHAEHAARLLELPGLIRQSDIDNLRQGSPDFANIARRLHDAPAGTNFYFQPPFTHVPASSGPWWYLYLLMRYFAYPNLVLCHDEVLYDSSRETYRERFIGSAQRYSDLDWVREHDIRSVILYREGRIIVLPVESPITL